MAASQYSILRQYTPYVSPYNIDLIKDVTMYKQGKVDAAREKIYTQIDYLMGQEIDKAESRVYMEDKMANMIANINQKFKGVDLSSDGVTRAIQGEISSVLDDTVINAIAGTKEGRRMQKEISAIRQNHPELYSPINEWYAMSPYYEWLNDGNAGSRLGSLHYSPYIDYNKELNKAISDFRENNKGRKVQVQEYDSKGNPTGAITEVNIDELSDAQVRSQISANLSENMRNQMRIEASYMAATNPVFRDKGMVGQYLMQYPNRYDKQISALEAKKKSVGDNKGLLNEINNKIQEAKNQKAATNKEISTILQTGDPVSAAAFVVSNNLFDRMSDAWRYDNTTFERKKDDVYFAQLKEARDQSKFLADNAKTMADIALINEQLAQAKIETQFMQTHGRKMGTKGVGGTDGGIQAGSGPVATHSGTGDTGDKSLANLPYEKLNMVSEERRASLLRLFNSLSKEYRNSILNDADYEEKFTPGLYAGMSDEEKVYEYLRRNGGHKNGFLNSGDNSIADAYESVTKANANMNGVIKSIDLVSDMQISNIITDKNIKSVSSLLSSLPDEDIANISNVSKSGEIGGIVLGAALISGVGSMNERYSGFLGGVRKLGRVLYGEGYDEYLRNMDSASGKTGSETSSIALINAMKKINGDPNFNILDYVEIKKGGYVGLKEKTGDEPITISQLRYLSNNLDVSDSIASSIGESVKEAISQEAISDKLSQSHFLDSYKKFTWQKGYPQDSDMANQFRALSAIVAGKTEGLNGASINNVHMSLEVDGGKIRRFLTSQYGSGEGARMTTPIEVTDAELMENGFDPSVTEINFPTDSYKSDFHTCDFVDTGKEEGFLYDEYLYDKGLSGFASKADVKNTLYDDIKNYGSYLSQEDMNVIKTLSDNFVDMSDKISVRLEGVNNRGGRKLIINFYDKETIDSSNPELLFSDFIKFEKGEGEFVDYYNDILEICPQFYYMKYVQGAISERLNQMRDAYIRGIKINSSDDKFSKLNDFLIKQYGSESK